jgi:excisionase family DNA binding protein
MKEKQEYVTIQELAKSLGISRIAVYKKVKAGKIEAIRIGRNYAIPINNTISKKMLKSDETQIEAAVRKTVKDYGDVLKKLGKE